MIITAKFNGKCAKCGKPTPQGSEIDYVEKKAYHPGCAPGEQIELPDAATYELADRLGFREYSQAELDGKVGGDGNLQFLPVPGPVDLEPGPGLTSGRDALWRMPASAGSEDQEN